jgi:hypothetical protein
VHFLVLRQDGDDGAEALVCSGTVEDVRVAMEAAVLTVERLTGNKRPSIHRAI